MQENDNTVRKYSIEELNALIARIRTMKDVTEEDIAKQLGYNEGYISQTRSRGKVPTKFIEKIQMKYKDELQNAKKVFGEIDDREHMVALLKDSNRALIQAMDITSSPKILNEIKEIQKENKAIVSSSRDLRQEIKEIKERQSALRELILLIAWMPGKKSVYNKSIEILQKYNFSEGIL